MNVIRRSLNTHFWFVGIKISFLGFCFPIVSPLIPDSFVCTILEYWNYIKKLLQRFIDSLYASTELGNKYSFDLAAADADCL